MSSSHLSPKITPSGRFTLERTADALPLDPAVEKRILDANLMGGVYPLVHLGLVESGTALPPAWAFWRGFSGRLMTAVCTTPGLSEATDIGEVGHPSPLEMEMLASAVPMMTGSEYVDGRGLQWLWDEMLEALRDLVRLSDGTVQEFFRKWNPAWNLVGRVHFNLAENRRDPEAPFAFMASYTTGLAAGGSAARHLPLGQALREYAGQANRQGLLSLLRPVQAAAEACPWLKEMVDSKEIFQPLRWTPPEAYTFLQDVSTLEAAGVVVRMPASWPAGRPSRPKVTAVVGAKSPSGQRRESLLDLDTHVTVDGEELTAAEVAQLLAGTDGLALIRGKWVELDRGRLQQVMERFRLAQRAAEAGGLSFAEAMRMVAGANVTAPGEDELSDRQWADVVAGPWLAELLRGLRTPEGLAVVEPGDALQATLRPYQQVGLRWLYLLSKLGLGACLADDMGLGKTIQVIALLLVLKRENGHGNKPALLVAPASLLANWASEVERFAPSLRVWIAHTSRTPATELKAADPERLEHTDLVITSYGSLLRLPWLESMQWSLAVLDEAQAIKNPSSQQSRAVRTLQADTRIALTGTPVENRLMDLWSIFDFVNPGLLGNARQFASYTKSMSGRACNPYGPLRDLVRPYILRRLKTDKRVIADLPDKTEMASFCSLSKKQVALYNQAVDYLAEQLKSADGIQRRGLVLASLMRLKQICNHPSQWLSDGKWKEADSGKFERLRELAETISSRQEKLLVFTQFQEIIEPLSAFLGEIFGAQGLILHGGTPVKQRKELVRRFQEDEGCPFFVLSLKAGGTGLNLTAASHVVHFDRWWNPAVENQATDRAFRIGQTKNVLVHKFVCIGTVEDKIEQMIKDKKHLANEVLDHGGEIVLTEMKDEELLAMVRLDLNAAMDEV